MKEITFKQKIILLTFSGVILLLIECFFYSFHTPSRLETITAIIKEDQELFWKGRANYKGRFFGEEVKHNKLGLRTNHDMNADILVMGASPSYGWGVKKNETYSDRLNKLLLPKYPGLKIVNASTIGYSSHQGVKLLSSIIKKYDPKIVTISYVINDVDHYRFFKNSKMPDKDITIQSSSAAIISNLLNTSYTIKYLASKISKLPAPSSVRVSKDDYRMNLSKMVTIIRENGSKPLFIKFPVNLDSRQKQDPQLLKKCPPPKLSALELHDCYLKFRPDAKANQLRKVLSYKSFLLGQDYNKVMQNLSTELNVPIVDVSSSLLSKNEYFLVDKQDPIHPNSKGHEVIASLLEYPVANLLSK